MAMHRAYSLLTIKEIDEEKRIVRGIASTPTPDRIGDIVEPMGAKFQTPMPLLLHHQHSEPVGHVTFAKPTKAGIPFEAEIPAVTEPGKVKDRVDEALHSLKYKLIGAVSIGFKALKDGIEILDDGGLRFKEWEWLELSLVTIPANPDAVIQSFKSLDPEQIEEALDLACDVSIAAAKAALSTPEAKPAASGKRSRAVHIAGDPAIKKGAKAMNIAEQLKQFEAKREALDARLEEIMQKAADEGRTLEDDESEEHSDLTAELKAVDEHLTRLRAMEKRQAERAQPVDPVVVKNTTTGSDARGGAIHVRQNLPPGVEFARYAICVALGHKNQVSPIDVAAARYPDNPRIANYIKAQVAAGTTSHTTWAAPLAQADNQFVGDFVDFLRPMTILGKFGVNGVPATRSVPFNVTIPGQTSGGSGYWVGQGKAKPLTSFNFQRTTFPFTKVANIAVITDELLRFSSPSAEGLVRDSLAAALQERLDTDFIDPAITEVAGVNPASVTSGATGIDSAGTDADGVRADVKALVDAFIAANIPLTTGVWVMPNRVALSLSLMLNALGQPEFPMITMNGGTFFGMPVITSEYVPTAQGSPEGDMVALVAASEIWVADDGGADVAVSREASLEMATDPTMASAGVGSPEAPTEVTTVSMFQTNSIAIRAEREIHWKLRRSAAVQYVNSVAYA